MKEPHDLPAEPGRRRLREHRDLPSDRRGRGSRSVLPGRRFVVATESQESPGSALPQPHAVRLMSLDEAVALTPWKVPWRTLLLPKGSSLPGPGSPHPGRVPVADVCGWSDVSLFVEWEPQRWLGLSGHVPGTSGGSPGHGGALLGLGGSPPLRFGCPLLQEVLLGVGSSPGHVSGSPWHRELSWAQGALPALCHVHLGMGGTPGCVPGTPGGLSWPPWRGQLVPTALILGRAWISFSPCSAAVGQRWGGTDISKLGLPSGNSFYLTNRKRSGLSRLGGRGSAPALLSSFAVTKLN